MSRIVHAIRDLDQFEAQILDLIFEVIPAEQGVILLDNKSGEKFGSVFGRHRTCAASQPMTVSRTILKQVMEQGLAILAADIEGNACSNQAGEPGEFQGAIAVVRSAECLSENHRLHLSGDEQRGRAL